MKLLRNPVYMLLNLASVFEMVIVTGFITFVPKYLETQFGLRTSQANLYTGKGDQWCIFTLWTSSRLRLLLMSIVGNFLHFATRICPTCRYPFPPVHRLFHNLWWWNFMCRCQISAVCISISLICYQQPMLYYYSYSHALRGSSG